MSDSFVSGTASIDPYATAQIPTFASDMGSSTALAAVPAQVYEQRVESPAALAAPEEPEFASIFIPDEDEDQELPPARGRIIALVAVAALLAGLIWITIPSVHKVFATGGPSAPTSAASQASQTPQAPITISAIEYVDPDGSPGPEVNPNLAIDADPQSSWKSYPYPSSDLSQAGPFGLTLTLAAPATVHEVKLIVYGQGGHVDVLAQAPKNNKDAVTPLASGTMSEKTSLKLTQPTELSTLVIWFTELPKATDGQYWIDLGDIKVS